MTRLLVLGASGQIARHVIAMLGGDADVDMTLFARNAARVGDIPDNASVLQGDVLNPDALNGAVAGQDIVYANLTGEDIDDQARAIIAVMDVKGVKRLIFVAALGIYDEVPGKFGEWNNAVIGEDLKPFRRAADAIEASGLDYTILRPAWLTDYDEVDYELTERDEPFRGTEISRKSVADCIAGLVRDPTLHIGGNVGLNKAGTDGSKPTFM